MEQRADAYSLRRVTVRKLDSFPVGKEEQRIKTADPYHYGCSVQGRTLGDYWKDRGVLDFRLGRRVYRFEKHLGNKFHMTC